MYPRAAIWQTRGGNRGIYGSPSGNISPAGHVGPRQSYNIANCILLHTGPRENVARHIGGKRRPGGPRGAKHKGPKGIQVPKGPNRGTKGCEPPNIWFPVGKPHQPVTDVTGMSLRRNRPCGASARVNVPRSEDRGPFGNPFRTVSATKALGASFPPPPFDVLAL